MKDANFFRRNPDFLLLWAGQIFSQSGGRMYQIAMIWWILSLVSTGSGKLVGLFMVVAALPPILFVKSIGRTIDASSSRRVLITCDSLAFLLLGAVGLSLGKGWLTLPAAYAVGFVSASLQAFIDPTLNKSVAEVVPEKDVEQAVSLLASTQSLANFAGALLGALVIGSLGIAGTVVASAAGYLICSTATTLARFRYAKPREAAATEERELSGWEVLDRYPLLRKILIGFGFINFFGTPLLVVLPIYVKRTLLGGASLLGGLEAGVWLGLILGTFVAPWIGFGGSRTKLSAVLLTVMGICLALPGLIIRVPVYFTALAVAGAMIGINNVKFIALFQKAVDPALKGRFFAVMSAVIGFSFPIAYFVFGFLTDLVSPPNVCLIQGAGVAAVAAFFLFLEEPAVAKTKLVEAEA